MADNVALPAVGTQVGTQERATIHYQRHAASDTAARTVVGANSSAVILIAAGAVVRFGVSILNLGTTDLYLGCGPVNPTLTNCTAIVKPGGYWEAPYKYRGEVRGIWAGSPSGNAIITEFTG